MFSSSSSWRRRKTDFYFNLGFTFTYSRYNLKITETFLVVKCTDLSEYRIVSLK